MLVGLFSGILTSIGVGGGFILIPVLVKAMNYSQQQAQLTNLIYFIPTSIVSIYFHRKNDFIKIDIVKSIIPFSIVGAVIGTVLTLVISTTMLSKFFGLFLLVLGIKQFFKLKGE